MKKILAILALLPLSATAEYIDHGTYFHDTTTGLYWLKLTESRNVSYDDMKDQFGFGQPFWGWRHAQPPALTASGVITAGAFSGRKNSKTSFGCSATPTTPTWMKAIPTLMFHQPAREARTVTSANAATQPAPTTGIMCITFKSGTGSL